MDRVTIDRCCSPAGLTSFALLLLHAFEETNDTVRLNIHQPGACFALAVTHADPGCPELVITLKKPLAHLWIRLPPGAQRFSAKLNHQEIAGTIHADYLQSVWRGNRAQSLQPPQIPIRQSLFPA